MSNEKTRGGCLVVGPDAQHGVERTGSAGGGTELAGGAALPNVIGRASTEEKPKEGEEKLDPQGEVGTPTA